MTFLAAVVVAFVAMEAVTYATHRWVMHGVGIVLHRSHHRVRSEGWEANDWFPVVFAALGLTAAALGTNVGSLSLLFPVSIGAASYGVAYGLVHDVYIHRRVRLFRSEHALLERLKAAHELHHRFGGEPYGMLFPVTRGSVPSHVPVEP
jgi:beta-carotene 3-hydroxylase